MTRSFPRTSQMASWLYARLPLPSLSFLLHAAIVFCIVTSVTFQWAHHQMMEVGQ